MLLKAGARIGGIRPEILFGACILDDIHKAIVLGADFVVTECTGGTHHPGSLHYIGLAIDIRTRDMTDAQKQAFYTQGRSALGEDFDLVEENDHAHLEFDPKTPINGTVSKPPAPPAPPTTGSST